MPELELIVPAMGVRISPEIDVSPAFDEIGEIASGLISWYARPLHGTDIEIAVSYDGGDSFKELVNGEYIPEADRLNDDPTLTLRYSMRSHLAQVNPDEAPKLYIVSVILSNEERETWELEDLSQLDWSDE